MTPHDRLMYTYIYQFCFYKKYFKKIKLFHKTKKIIIPPTYPNFEKHVARNTLTFYFFWPYLYQ